ncbi:MAG: hypothetical protein QNK30_13020 [Bacteroidales bacterium]|nr:hypothetical protein [Bacteroidales bacterium]
MNTKAVFLKLFAILIVAIYIGSCEKIADEINDIRSAEESTTALMLFSDIFAQADIAAKMISEPSTLKSHVFAIDGGCGTITIEPLGTTFPKNITIDYGETNCTGLDQRERRGKIVAQVSDWYRNTGCELSISTDEYFLDDYKVEGTKVVTNKGKNEFQQIYFTVEVSDGVITKPDQGIIHWVTNRTRTWIAGEDTYLNVLDDEYELAGGASGKTTRDKDFTLDITKPLNVKGDCPWLRGGTIDIKVNNTVTITTDYGDGDCTPSATATILGKSFPFIMK